MSLASMIGTGMALYGASKARSSARASYESSGLAYPSVKNMSQKYAAGVGGLPAASSKARTAVSSSSGTSTLDDYFSRLQSITAANNAWSAAQAQKQMDFQKQSAADAMKFNHDEAELSRLWQERMSNTAHQREIKDLQAAGLNPVLSAMGGSGAPVTSGATASGYTSSGAKGDTDTSLAPALVSLIGSVISAQASMANTITSAAAQERIADKEVSGALQRALISAGSAREVAGMQGQASRDVANIYGQTSRDVAGINGETSRVVALIGAKASVSSAQIHAAGQAAAAQISGQYGLSIAQTNQLTGILTTSMETASRESIDAANRQLKKAMQNSDFDFQFRFAKDQYGRDWKLHMWDNGTDILQSVIGAGAQLGAAAMRGSPSYTTNNIINRR